MRFKSFVVVTDNDKESLFRLSGQKNRVIGGWNWGQYFVEVLMSSYVNSGFSHSRAQRTTLNLFLVRWRISFVNINKFKELKNR